MHNILHVDFISAEMTHNAVFLSNLLLMKNDYESIIHFDIIVPWLSVISIVIRPFSRGLREERLVTGHLGATAFSKSHIHQQTALFLSIMTVVNTLHINTCLGSDLCCVWISVAHVFL